MGKKLSLPGVMNESLSQITAAGLPAIKYVRVETK
jgi:hypothetical protein